MQPLAGIDAALSRAVEAKEVPGVVALAATDTGVLYEGAFGLRDIVDGPAMTRDSVFRIASMTKAVTSVAAMQLVEQGKLPLDEPIGNVLPELAAPQVLEGFDSSGAPRLRSAQTPDHVAPSADPHSRLRLRGLEPGADPLCRRNRHALLHDWQARLRCVHRWFSIRASAGSMASTSIGSGAQSKQSPDSRSTPISARISLPRSA